MNGRDVLLTAIACLCIAGTCGAISTREWANTVVFSLGFLGCIILLLDREGPVSGE